MSSEAESLSSPDSYFSLLFSGDSVSLIFAL
jgi:hypothetical protein